MTTPRTLVDVFRNLGASPKPDLLLYKKDGRWVPISTAEFTDRVKAVSAALGTLGVPDGGAVVLLSENRPEWPTIDFACQCYGAVLVPVFPTMVADQAEYIVRDSGATVAFASTPEQAAKLVAEAEEKASAAKSEFEAARQEVASREAARKPRWGISSTGLVTGLVVLVLAAWLFGLLAESWALLLRLAGDVRETRDLLSRIVPVAAVSEIGSAPSLKTPEPPTDSSSLGLTSAE